MSPRQGQAEDGAIGAWNRDMEGQENDVEVSFSKSSGWGPELLWDRDLLAFLLSDRGNPNSVSSEVICELYNFLSCWSLLTRM